LAATALNIGTTEHHAR